MLSKFDDISMRLNSNLQQHYFISNLRQSLWYWERLLKFWLKSGEKITWYLSYSLETCSLGTRQFLVFEQLDIFSKTGRLELNGTVTGILSVNLIVYVDILSSTKPWNARKCFTELSILQCKRINTVISDWLGWNFERLLLLSY